MKRAFTTKRAECQKNVFIHLAEARAGREAVRGFTLIEAMIAVTILTLAVAGPLYTANSAIVASMIARDKLTASYLAQEGIEYVRAMRDYEFLAAYNDPSVTDKSGTAWSNFLTGGVDQLGSVERCRPNAITPTAACSIDPSLSMGYGTGSSIFRCTAGGACAKLYLFDDGAGRYRYVTERNSSLGTATPFSRTIQVVDIPGTTDPASPEAPYPDKRIVSTVSWSYHGTQHTVTIYDHLTRWQ
ncbi:MAG: prepilin-type N-terminal cleavage/methylation domain-containing protein [Candidatus Paceibacterota bacterium]|jgi:prepilin-type N-terminal cleavage/methylation domain-containing protein